jgi:hypothetical protein
LAGISSGFENYAGNNDYDTAAYIGGGERNLALAKYATVGGGSQDTALAAYSFVGGGLGNAAAGSFSTVSGGMFNRASGGYGTIAGGSRNLASADRATVGGGTDNDATGMYSTIPGGRFCTASGIYSFAAGRQAIAQHNGAFVWSDQTGTNFYSERTDQFRVRANGGARFDDAGQWFNIYDDGTDLVTTSTGAHLTLTGVWTNSSDRNLKENFTAIDREALLEKIAALPITEWNYKAGPENVKHIGPVAQDFYALFGVGTDDKSISSIDPAGIALAAIQALHEKTKKINELERELAEVKAMMRQLIEAEK